MTFEELLERAQQGYRSTGLDSDLTGWWNSGMQQVKPPGENPKGDSLGRWIVVELWDTFDADASNEAQLNGAELTMRRGAQDLEAVADAMSP